MSPNLTVGWIKRGMNTIAATSSGSTVANRVRRFLFSAVVDPLRLIHPPLGFVIARSALCDEAISNFLA